MMGLFGYITSTLKKDVNILANNIPQVGTQLKRLENVYETEKAVAKNILSTTGLVEAEPISATDSNSSLGKIGAAIANNPKTAALLIAVPASSTVRAAVPTVISKLPTVVKIGGVIAAPVAVGVAVSSPVKTTEAILNTPSALNNVGTNVGGFINDPSTANAKKIFTDNPYTTSFLVGLGLVATGATVGSSVPTLVGAYETNKNTKSIEKSNELIQKATGGGNLPTPPTNNLPPTPVPPPVASSQKEPITAETQVIGKEPSTKARARRRSRSRNDTPSLKLQILNQNNYIAHA